jgi:hypothetical protein
VNQHSYWAATLLEEESDEQSLPEALMSVLSSLSAKHEFLDDVRSSGGRIELYVFWYFEEGSSNIGETLDHSLLARLAALRIDLSLDLYSADYGSIVES